MILRPRSYLNAICVCFGLAEAEQCRVKRGRGTRKKLFSWN